MSVRLGRIIGIPITIHYTMWFVFLLIAWSLASSMPLQYPGLSTATYWGIGIVSAVVLFASVLVHELAHSYIAKKNGLHIARITLFFFGGVSEMTQEPRDPSLEARMAAAGPFTSFLIALVLGFGWFLGNLAHAPIAVVVILQYGAFINAILGVFNLLPAFPLDGGRVLRGVIWKRYNSFLRATKTATRVSEALSVLMIGAGLVFAVFGEFLNGIWLVFLGWFIRSGAETGLRQTIMEETLSGMKVESVMTREVLTVPPNITVQQLISDYFLVHPHGGYPVVSEGEILGVVTLQCARSVPKERREATTVKEAMIPCERSVMINRSMSALDAMNMMARENVGRVLVVEGNELVGIVTRGDLIRAIQTRQELG